ncbi:flavin reductase family protein [Nocardioides sp.]|uniref:flavin reductase family protein n=1 Tax=Nocardioides sp. TaxID=35761 RepID=UPI002B7419FC|nr:flavin reductase family protein [Nocardioides sp.]HSX66135.1 flavin reductase family protein [Nocardioides sp.]
MSSDDISTGDFDALAAATDAAMLIVTTADGEERGGCLVGFHSQSSIDPPRYSVWLSKANHTYRLALRTDHLVLHFLGEEHRELAELFGTRTGDDTDKFAGLATGTGPHGVPVLLDVPGRLVVRRLALLDEGGDHVCLTTEPVRVDGGAPHAPLRLSACCDFTPGHSNDERHSPPTERAAD